MLLGQPFRNSQSGLLGGRYIGHRVRGCFTARMESLWRQFWSPTPAWRVPPAKLSPCVCSPGACGRLESKSTSASVLGAGAWQWGSGVCFLQVAISLRGWLQSRNACRAASKKRDGCCLASFRSKIPLPFSWQGECGLGRFLWVLAIHLHEAHEQRFDRKQDLNVLERDCICRPEAAELLHARRT